MNELSASNRTRRADDRDKRMEMRFDKAFPVTVGSEIYGDSPAVARNISFKGMLIEMLEPLPLGCFVTVHFRMPDGGGDIVARAEVKHHYCFNFARDDGPYRARGIGLRFVEFIEDSAERWRETFTRTRVLH
ncbi:PilZ domain-containing protein [Haliangium ochraceum]|uniref:Type IV pilus assembly PilZ n=1 Tax=Haliangium ochraceum (strain DSM 14365 / JCM 11303 / SMP-2) TaxID=502025 RepID=D0LII5_HALO1|nr:PilZ domain-containing protein [Haliangium ochraceum]ACY18341.1 type IV pilus assembly PilZ [Haliangium ochraceum DSM 14365]